MAVTAIPRTHTPQAESRTRIDLAACYRLVDLFGWSDLINTHITVVELDDARSKLLTAWCCPNSTRAPHDGRAYRRS